MTRGRYHLPSYWNYESGMKIRRAPDYCGGFYFQRHCYHEGDDHGYFFHCLLVSVVHIEAIKVVFWTKASFTWSVVSAQRACWQLFKVGVAKASERVFLFSQMKVYCTVLWFSDMRTLQCAALFMVDWAYKLTNSKNNAIFDVGDNQDALWLIANTGVPEVLWVKANGLKVDPLLTGLKAELWDYDSFPSWFWGFGTVGFVRLGATSYPWSRNEDVA